MIDDKNVVLELERIIDTFLDLSTKYEIFLNKDISDEIKIMCQETFAIFPNIEEIEETFGKQIMKIRKFKKKFENESIEEKNSLLEEAREIEKRAVSFDKNISNNIKRNTITNIVNREEKKRVYDGIELSSDERVEEGIIMTEGSASIIGKAAAFNRSQFKKEAAQRIVDNDMDDSDDGKAIRSLSFKPVNNSGVRDIEKTRAERAGGVSKSTRYTHQQAPGFRGTSHVASEVKQGSFVTNDIVEGDKITVKNKTIVGLGMKRYNEDEKGRKIIPKRVLTRDTTGIVTKVDEEYVYFQTSDKEIFLVGEQHLNKIEII